MAVSQTSPATTRESRYSRQPEQEIAFQQGLLFYQGGQLARAEQQFREVIQADPGDAEAYYYLGLSQLDQGKAQQAVQSFDESIRLDPTWPEVRAARARANIRLGQYDAAETDLKFLEPDPAWRGYVHHHRGMAYYFKGELERAAEEFAAAKAAGSPESAPAEFYEGLTYLRMRDLVRARSTFREAYLGADRDPTVAAASRQLDAVLAAQQRRDKPWELQFTLASEWDSNVIQIGAGVPNPEGISDESDFRYVFQPRGSYSIFRSEGRDFEAGVEASGYFAWQQDLSDFDTESYQAGPFVSYRITKSLYASIRYGYNYIRVGHEGFLRRHLITPQVTLVERDFGYTSAFYQFQERDFLDEQGLGPLRRSGQNHGIGVVQGIKLPAVFEGAGNGNLELSYRFENQSADGSDYDGNFHSVGATLYAPLPVWKLRADVGVSVDYNDYSNANSLDASGDERRDVEWNVVSGLTRELGENWAIRVDYAYTDNDSNVRTAGGAEPYSYDRHQIGVRLIFSY
ncbi:tetratricopeptide repeat protein [Fontivita pretiosa]|uniref:tetratricopeptide repeat protein n=1 Tax=Fontivita pretiosa TaxID=2989684 RepID=UPI003D168CCB